MEIICSIVSQGNLQEKDITRDDGTVTRMATMDFVLRSGGDTFACTMFNDKARHQGLTRSDCFYKAVLKAEVKDYKDKENKQRFLTSLRLESINFL